MQHSLFGAVAETPKTTDTVFRQTHRDTPISEALLTVFDLETTGLQPRRNAITELTAIQYVDLTEADRYSTLVNPTEAIPEEITAITGITQAMVANAPPPVVVLSEFSRLIGETPLLVGHNVSFDVNFVRVKLEEVGLEAFIPRIDPARALCTKVLAQKLIPGLPSYAGVAVANHFGIVNPNAHRAEYDVKMTAEIIYALFKVLVEKDPSIKTIGDVLEYQGGIGL